MQLKCIICLERFVLYNGCDSIKEREKQKHEAMRNLHYWKDITLDTFENPKAELKNDGKDGNWFAPLRFHILPKLGYFHVSEITQTEIHNTLAPIWHTKAWSSSYCIEPPQFCFKHAAALG